MTFPRAIAATIFLVVCLSVAAATAYGVVTGPGPCDRGSSLDTGGC